MNIDPLARLYRWIEYAVFGRALERARFVFLDCLVRRQRVLILGEGDGRALQRLLAAAPVAQVDVVELSARMIALARRRVEHSDRVCFHPGDARTTHWPKSNYDGVLTLFFLDCFSEVETRALIERIADAMTPDAIWLVSDFAIPQRGWRRWHAKSWIWIMYAFFAATTGLKVRSLPPIEPLLIGAGLRRLEMVEQRGGLIRSAVWTKEPLPAASTGPSAPHISSRTS